jgi:C1A family cysteine protease
VFEWLVRKLDPSAWFKTSMLAIYYWARALDGMQGSDSGTYPKSAVTAMAQTGMAHDSLWPFGSEQNCNSADYPEPTTVNTAPSSNVVSDASSNKITKYSSVATGTVVSGSGDSVVTVMGLNDAKGALASGYPVMFILCADEYDGLMHSSPMSGQSYGLIPDLSDWSTAPDHGQIIMGYNDSISNLDGSTGAFIVKNSWSTLWGDLGYGYLSYNYANNSAIYDGWIITGESEIVVPTPGPTPGGAPNVNINVNIRTYQPGVE